VAWVALIPLLPALAFAAMLPMSRRVRNSFRWLPTVATAVSLVLAVAAFLSVVAAGGEEPAYQATFAIASLGGSPLTVGLRLDAVSAIMLLVVTVVAACVQVFSIDYMRSEERQGWYFAVLSLFTAAMLLLVLAGDFLLLYMSWEVMGLCSYLLIGFWHEKEAARLASIKAFLTTRVGDVGFAIGLAAMWASARSFCFDVVLHGFAWTVPAATIVAVGLLLGAMGKSAQVPLHVWLPDAMAGPTPASALIHAATMVAAGVYLVARALPIFEAAAPWVLPVVMAIGVVTAIVGALLAVVQYDIKKVLAYSTISQLGYMFIALGTGGEVAALFHLMTHAFFKSLLFLGAGAIIHATHTQDIREMGGLRKSMPWTTTVFIFGALALSGVFPFSGFWSKDDILMALYTNGHWYSQVALVAALLVAALTAFYMTRVCVRVFGGVEKAHAHEAHPLMVAPMAVLAAITAVVGFSSVAFAGFLGEIKGGLDLGMATVGTIAALSGIAVGVWVFGMKKVDTEALKRRSPMLQAAFEQGFFFDITYEHTLVKGYFALSQWLAKFDLSFVDGAVNGVATVWSKLSTLAWSADAHVIDGAVNGLASAVARAGARVRTLQAGEVQGYQRLAYGALLVLLGASLVAPFVGATAALAGGAVVLLLMGVLVVGGT
jgi:NADH-quinone oxidoreductase subunit L